MSTDTNLLDASKPMKSTSVMFAAGIALATELGARGAPGRRCWNGQAWRSWRIVEGAMAQQEMIDAGGSPIQRRDFQVFAQAEYESLCETIAERLTTDSLPPDEAYWWTRILTAEAVMRLNHGGTRQESSPNSADAVREQLAA
jgi:hypothetical protein